MRKYQKLDGTVLKLIAVISMVFDHVGDNFFPEWTWMRVIGRIAMPIFAFFVAEGYLHTHDRKKYLIRLLIFGLISEAPFDLLTAGKVLEFSHQNIMLTFAWAVVGLMAFDRLTEKADSKSSTVLGVVSIFVFLILALVLKLDYDMVAVGLVYIFVMLNDRGLDAKIVAGVIFYTLMRNVGVYWYALFGFIFLFFYNGQRGRGMKWFFYAFYPGHLLLLYLLKLALAR
ncbi:MAG: hypothetical protein IJ091_09220 [Oscillospiraceae bacterium]|nr:hypothetical protein [Oscillospiraceae bacterium]